MNTCPWKGWIKGHPYPQTHIHKSTHTHKPKVTYGGVVVAPTALPRSEQKKPVWSRPHRATCSMQGLGSRGGGVNQAFDVCACASVLSYVLMTDRRIYGRQAFLVEATHSHFYPLGMVNEGTYVLECPQQCRPLDLGDGREVQRAVPADSTIHTRQQAASARQGDVLKTTEPLTRLADTLNREWVSHFPCLFS